MLLFGLTVGATGAVGSTYNFMAPLYRHLIAAHERGDAVEARRLQMESRRMIFKIVCHGGLAAQKVAMASAGFDCGPCRLPLPRLDTAQVSSIQDLFKSLPPEHQ